MNMNNSKKPLTNSNKKLQPILRDFESQQQKYIKSVNIFATLTQAKTMTKIGIIMGRASQLRSVMNWIHAVPACCKE